MENSYINQIGSLKMNLMNLNLLKNKSKTIKNNNSNISYSINNINLYQNEITEIKEKLKNSQFEVINLRENLILNQKNQKDLIEKTKLIDKELKNILIYY